MVRPFRFGDIFLIQRLGRQATKLNIVQATLHRQSAVGASLSSLLPWKHGKATTYILRQRGHRLARDGFLQVQRRPGLPELDIIFLAPGLDARRGHPAIWEKLLSHHAYEAAHRRIERIYADVPDQPLPVSTFSHAGFRTYDRQTIWRLTPRAVDDYSSMLTADFRPQSASDEWALKELYYRIVPEAVQVAEGAQHGAALRPPILGWSQGGSWASYVLLDRRVVRGAVKFARGNRAYWLQIWCDYTDPDMTQMHQLLRFALSVVNRQYSGMSQRLPVFMGVSEYHGALGTALSDYGFAPVTDRAKMVKHVFQWIREASRATPSTRETAPTVVAAPFDLGHESPFRSHGIGTSHEEMAGVVVAPVRWKVSASYTRPGTGRSRVSMD